jgi:hypothetical protein
MDKYKLLYTFMFVCVCVYTFLIQFNSYISLWTNSISDDDDDITTSYYKGANSGIISPS